MEKIVFPYQRLVLLYQGLFFLFPELSLRGVRYSKAGKFIDNIAFAGFPLLGVTPQKYPIIFFYNFIIYSWYKLSQLGHFPGIVK